MKRPTLAVLVALLSLPLACGRKPQPLYIRKKTVKESPFPPPVKADVPPELEARLRATILAHVVCRPFGQEEKTDVARLLKALGSPEFAERESASKKLEAYGAHALPALREAAEDQDPEVADRAAAIARAIESHRAGEELAARLLETQLQSLAVIDAIHAEKTAALNELRESGANRAETSNLRGTCEALRGLRSSVASPDYLGMARDLYLSRRYDESVKMLRAYSKAPGGDPLLKQRVVFAIHLVQTEKSAEARRRKKAEAAGQPYPNRQSRLETRMLGGWGGIRRMRFDMILGRMRTFDGKTLRRR